jgi:hypothetical protein
MIIGGGGAVPTAAATTTSTSTPIPGPLEPVVGGGTGRPGDHHGPNRMQRRLPGQHRRIVPVDHRAVVADLRRRELQGIHYRDRAHRQ